MVEPDYYNVNGLSPIKAFEQGLISVDEYIGFCKGNVIKYTVRAGEKDDDPLLDIVKAMDYLHYLHQALKIKNKNEMENYTIIGDDDLCDNISVEDLEDKLKEVQDHINMFKDDYLQIHSEESNIDDDSVYADDDTIVKYDYIPKTKLRPKPTDESLRHLCVSEDNGFLNKLQNFFSNI